MMAISSKRIGKNVTNVSAIEVLMIRIEGDSSDIYELSPPSLEKNTIRLWKAYMETDIVRTISIQTWPIK